MDKPITLATIGAFLLQVLDIMATVGAVIVGFVLGLYLIDRLSKWLSTSAGEQGPRKTLPPGAEGSVLSSANRRPNGHGQFFP